MGVSIQDLQPKSFTVKVKGQELTARPLKLSDALTLSKLGDVFQNTKDYNLEQIDAAEKDIDKVIKSIVPELAEIDLDMGIVIDVITQLMESIEPSDNKELREKGVTFGDPKEETK